MAENGSRYINRELSWLEFNQRVLDESKDESVPLFERLRFLAISGSNLDEFFMVRVGGLQMLMEQGVTKRDPSGMTPAEQLEAICQRTHRMVDDQYTHFADRLEPSLDRAGVRRVRPGDLTEQQSRLLINIFEDEVYAVLTPVGVEAPEDLPLLANGVLHLCVRVRRDAEAPPGSAFAVIPLGFALERFVTLQSSGGYEYMLLEDMVGLFVDMFFPGQQVLECVPFRITRNADLSVREDQAPDLLDEMEEVLEARKRSACVRLEFAEVASESMLAFLQEAFHVRDEHLYAISGPLDLSDFGSLAELEGFDSLKYETWNPQPPLAVYPTVSIFSTLSDQDVLLSHPYESFEPVCRLVEEAADDPDVLAVKQILYRTSRNSPIVAALQRAAASGKYVTAIVELKARFDEARNIEWAKAMEEAGVQVIYGVKGLKTHAKVCIVVRREPGGIQRYVHFGTGNYNEGTARLYSDVSLMSSDADLGADATTFFNAITGYSQPRHLRKLVAAPLALREALLEMIANETERKRQGQKARIMAKLNSLVDPEIIDALYTASQTGVNISLNVRGICCLRPGVEGLSDRINVISVVDRFLEHSRILYFYHGGDERVFISSADWMPRNLDRRIELLVPVEDSPCRNRLIRMLETYFKDTVKATRLLPDGRYERIRPQGRRRTLRSQEVLYREACQAVHEANQSRRTVFEPHRPSRPEQ